MEVFTIKADLAEVLDSDDNEAGVILNNDLYKITRVLSQIKF